MSWAIVAVGFVLSGVGYLLLTMRGIDRAQDEAEHYRLSVRFWLSLAVLGIVTGVSFAHPVIRFFEADRLAWVTVGLVSIPFAVVVIVGLRNAATLASAHWRRSGVLGRGVTLRARVVGRSRRAFQDIMSVVVEADLPVLEPTRELRYRSPDPVRTVVHRFVEHCPADHWRRFEPGCTVNLEVDPAAPDDRYAVHVFGEAVV